LEATLTKGVLVHPSLSSTRGRWGLLQRLGPDILSTVVTGEVFPKTCMGAADQQSSKRHQWLYCSDNQSYRFTAFPDGVRKVPPDGFMVALDGARAQIFAARDRLAHSCRLKAAGAQIGSPKAEIPQDEEDNYDQSDNVDDPVHVYPAI